MRYLTFILGIILMTLGVSLTMIANLGTSSWDAINYGLNKSFGLNIGLCIIVSSLIALIVAAIIRREFIRLTSFITSVLIGIAMDFWKKIIGLIVLNSIWEQYLVFFMGISITSLGIALYLIPKLPVNPIDFLMVTLTEKFELSILKSKIIIDTICILGAILFSGPIGIGTVIATLFVGPFVDFFSKTINKINHLYKVKNCSEQ